MFNNNNKYYKYEDFKNVEVVGFGTFGRVKSDYLTPNFKSYKDNNYLDPLETMQILKI